MTEPTVTLTHTQLGDILDVMLSELLPTSEVYDWQLELATDAIESIVPGIVVNVNPSDGRFVVNPAARSRGPAEERDLA